MADKTLIELWEIADATFEAIMEEYAAGAVVSAMAPTTVDGLEATVLHLAVPRYSLHLRKGDRIISQ
jgi:hypothetical protein